MKKLAIDVYYLNDSLARTVGVVFEDWSDQQPSDIIVDWCHQFGRYIPGQFYLRELPCILGLLQKVDLRDFDTVILDSYLKLRDDLGTDSPGLGVKLWEVIGQGYPHLDIWAVAKSKYGKCKQISCPIMRGESKTPLYVQALKESNDEAGRIVRDVMHGPFRLPTLLKILDQVTKKDDECESDT